MAVEILPREPARLQTAEPLKISGPHQSREERGQRLANLFIGEMVPLLVEVRQDFLDKEKNETICGVNTFTEYCVGVLRYSESHIRNLIAGQNPASAKHDGSANRKKPLPPIPSEAATELRRWFGTKYPAFKLSERGGRFDLTLSDLEPAEIKLLGDLLGDLRATKPTPVTVTPIEPAPTDPGDSPTPEPRDNLDTLGLRYIPDLFSATEADTYFVELSELPWEQHIIPMYGKKIPAPRLFQWMGVPPGKSSYSGGPTVAGTLYGGAINPIPWTVAALKIKEKVEALTGTRFDSLNINYYRDNKDHLGWHVDKQDEGLWTEPIASVSLGAVRRFQVRKHGEVKIYSVPLAHGSLVVMPAGFQENWKHRLAKTAKPCGPRINLTFRVMQAPANPDSNAKT